MSAYTPSQVFSNPVRLVIGPQQANLSGAYPYGGTPVGYVLRAWHEETEETFREMSEVRGRRTGGGRGFRESSFAFVLAQFDATIRNLLYAVVSAVVANGSPNVTGIGTAWTAAMIGNAVQFASQPGVSYVVQSVTDATHLVLTANYGGTGATTPLGFYAGANTTTTPDIGGTQQPGPFATGSPLLVAAESSDRPSMLIYAPAHSLGGKQHIDETLDKGREESWVVLPYDDSMGRDYFCDLIENLTL